MKVPVTRRTVEPLLERIIEWHEKGGDGVKGHLVGDGPFGLQSIQVR